jgi:hypothetical protein
MTVSRELLDLVGVQEVRREGDGFEPAGENIFFCGKENENHVIGTGFLCIRESLDSGTTIRHNTQIYISHKITHLAQTKDSTQNCTNNK